MRLLTSVLLVGASVGGVTGCGGANNAASAGGLAVETTPNGELDGPLEIRLEFSHAMVADEDIGEPYEAAPLSIEPDIEGEARWIDAHTLVFLPTSTLPVSTSFTATVPEGAKALDGKALAGPHSFEFSTERINGTATLLGSVERASAEPTVKLVFNHEVEFDAIAAECSYRSGDEVRRAKPSRDVRPGPGKVFAVVPDAPLEPNTPWTFSCAAALRGVAGNLGLLDPVEQSFKTFGPLSFVSLTPNGRDIVPETGMDLEIAFTNPLTEPYELQMSPAVPGFPERCYSLGDAPPGLRCQVALEPQTRYTLTVGGQQRDAFGQTLGEARVMEFRTADAEPTVSIESGYFVAELTRPALPLWTRNVGELQVRAVKVEAGNFHELQPLLRWWDEDPAKLDATSLEQRRVTVRVEGTRNRWGQHPIDPAALLGGEAGPGMYYVEVGSKDVTRGRLEDGVEKVLINFTDIGVVAKMSPSQGLVWATRLSSGEPLPGAVVAVRNSKGQITWTGKTDRRGIATLPGVQELSGRANSPEESTDELRLYVSRGTDWTMVNPTRNGELSTWNFNVLADYDRRPVRLRGFMHTDRGLYRPGEKVHIKGLARETRLGSPLKVPARREVAVKITGPRGRTMKEATARLSPFGGFWLDVDLPGDARLGDYAIQATLDSGVFSSSFQVEEYRPATFEVSAKTDVARVETRGAVEATIGANYLYGAPVRKGDVDVVVHSRPRRVRFEQHAEFRFLDERRYDRYYHYDPEYSQDLVTEDRLSLDGEGTARIAFSVAPSDVRQDADLLVRASVTAPNNEVISRSFSIPYFRSRRYFGIKAPSYFMEVGKTQRLEILGVSPTGKSLAGEARVEVTRRDWNCVWEDWGYRGSYQCKETRVPVRKETVKLRAGKPTPFSFKVDGSGEYWVVVAGEDERDAAAAMQFYAWGDGGGSWRTSDTMRFDLVADKQEYEVGDTATLILKTDLARATGLVTIERDGVLERRLIEITPDAKHIEVPIEASHAPNVYVSVALVQGRLGPGERGKPRMRMGLVNLPVRPHESELRVSVKTDREDYRPGDPVTATVRVTDARGRPVSAEVAITAADEGVLSLIGYKTPNPLPTFFSPWGLAVATATQYAYLKDIPAPDLERPATGGDFGGGSVRSRFMSTAVWLPSVVTNGAGVATARFEAPDNLTAFRVMAVAADRGARFGSGDVRFAVAKPLQLHRALPRFLTRGDELRGGVVVHNETGASGTATVSVRSNNVAIVRGPADKTVEVEAGGRVPVLFDIAARSEGSASLTFSVEMAGESDRVRYEFPVLDPSRVRTLHVAHGAATGPETIAVSLPDAALASSARVHVSVDPDGLAGIEEGLRELVGYPYGCLEQTTSKVIPMLAVRDLAESLDLDGLSGDSLKGFVKAGVTKIGRHQTEYGGFSLWPGGEPDAYYTAYALWGLHLAKKAGFEVDADRIADGIDYLKEDGKRSDSNTPFYSARGHLGNQAFALYVRAALGDDDPQAAIALRDNLSEIPLYGKAFVLRALAAGLGKDDPAVVELRDDLSAVARSAGASGSLIREPDEGELDGYMSGSVRTTAIVLGALIDVDPGNDSVLPLVRLLMKKRRGRPHWSTQDNLYSLLSLSDYAATRSGAPSVRVAVGDEQLITGPLRAKQRMRTGSAALSAAGAEVLIQPRGGEVHYSVEVRYRQRAETLVADANGLSIERDYLDPNGKPKRVFRVGDIVRVRLTVPLSSDVNHLMISDRLPGGFEPLNQRLATVGEVGRVESQRHAWGLHQEMRDERVDFASSYQWKATVVREYLARATSSGRFAVPPAVAELMYQPETNAHTGVETIEIQGR